MHCGATNPRATSLFPSLQASSSLSQLRSAPCWHLLYLPLLSSTCLPPSYLGFHTTIDLVVGWRRGARGGRPTDGDGDRRLAGMAKQSSCCHKKKLRRGLWSPEEDEKLMNHIAKYGHGCWSSVPKLAGGVYITYLHSLIWQCKCSYCYSRRLNRRSELPVHCVVVGLVDFVHQDLRGVARAAG